MIKKAKVKRQKKNTEHRIQNTGDFYIDELRIAIHSTLLSGRVCKIYFLHTLKIIEMYLCHITNRRSLIVNKEIRVYNKLHLPHNSVCKNNICTPYKLRIQVTCGSH